MEALLRFCTRRTSGWHSGAHAAFLAQAVDSVSLRVVLADSEVGCSDGFTIACAYSLYLVTLHGMPALP